jgi:hypothetical protein
MGRVIIGMDPHKRSATIEIIDDLEQVLMLMMAAFAVVWTRRKPKDPLRDALPGAGAGPARPGAGHHARRRTAQDSDVFSGTVRPNW